MALFLGIAFTPLWSQSPPADDEEIVIAGDGTKDLWEFRIDAGPGGLTYSVRYEASPGGTVAKRILTASAYRQDGSVRLELGVLTGEENPSANRFVSNAFNGMTRIPLGNYAVPRSGSLSVDAGAPYGFPVLEFRLGRPPGLCQGDLGNVIVTPSLRAQAFLRTEGGGCSVLLKNASGKRVLSIGSELRDDQGKLISSHAETELAPHGDQVLQIGAVDEPHPGRTPDVGRRRMVVTYCLFTDGTFEGASAPVKAVLAYLAGHASQASRFLAYLRSLPAHPADGFNLLPLIQSGIDRLPDSDPALEAKVITRIAPVNEDMVRSRLRSGLSSGKQEALEFLQEYEARHLPTGILPQPRYWELRQEQLANLLETATKALGGWPPEPSLVVVE